MYQINTCKQAIDIFHRTYLQSPQINVLPILLESVKISRECTRPLTLPDISYEMASPNLLVIFLICCFAAGASSHPFSLLDAGPGPGLLPWLLFFPQLLSSLMLGSPGSMPW
jgi:hypothetical protein